MSIPLYLPPCVTAAIDWMFEESQASKKLKRGPYLTQAAAPAFKAGRAALEYIVSCYASDTSQAGIN